MQIHSLQPTGAAQSVHRTASVKPAGPVPSTPAVHSVSTDQLDLSAEAQQLGQSQPASGIRSEKVAALREAIASGRYETPEKMSAALDRMLDTFA